MHVLRILPLRLFAIGVILCTSLIAAAQTIPLPLSISRAVIPLHADAGNYHTCAVRTDGTVACWGWDEYGQSSPPSGMFTTVSAGDIHTCGIRTDGTVSCWGDSTNGKSSPPTGTFTAISAGISHTCAIRTDGSADCWGDDTDGQSTVPVGTYIAISAGGFHTCGIKSDNTLVCWGQDAADQIKVPDGKYASVSAGSFHTCAVKTDNSLACWGANTQGQTSSPYGQFKAISAGYAHTCGIKIDNTLVCWGHDSEGQLGAPDGAFSAVSGGRFHTCAVTDDETLTCWGGDVYGQSKVPLPEVTLTASSLTLAENGGTVTVTIGLGMRPFQPVDVTLALAGTAQTGTDYTLVGSLTQTIGVESSTATVQLVGVGDALEEGAETILVTIAAVENAVQSTPQQLTVTIPGSDSPTVPPSATQPPATETPVPSTPTSNAPVNLLSNGGFESADLSPWTVTHGDKVRHKCKPEKANTGNCALMFKKGDTGTVTKLQQAIDATSLTLVKSNVINLMVYAKVGKGTVGKIKLKVTYSDTTSPSKKSYKFWRTKDYSAFSIFVTLDSANVQQINVQVKHRSGTGKLFVDDVAVHHYPPPVIVVDPTESVVP